MVAEVGQAADDGADALVAEVGQAADDGADALVAEVGQAADDGADALVAEVGQAADDGADASVAEVGQTADATAADDGAEVAQAGADAQTDGTAVGAEHEEDAARADVAAVGLDTEPKPRFWRLKWIFARRLCFGGLASALVFFVLSMTPSLVPRSALFQGIVSGVSLVSGYGIGSALSAGIRKVRSGEPSAKFKRVAWWVLLGSAVVVGPVALWWGSEWQQDLRRLMSMEQLKAYEWGLIVVLAVVVAAIVLIVSRVIRGGARALIGQLDKFLPRRVALIGGFTLAVVIVAGLFQGVLFDGMVSAVNQSYSVIDKGTSPWISQPQSELRSGGPGSAIDWDSLGVKGRDFAGEGGSPTVEEIAEFTGGEATEPIRVYAGLQSADSLDERVELALTDLENMGAFDRSVIAVMTTTGTGWVDENVADSFEFLHAGDTAAVAMQYSYLPSWVSFLVDRSKAADAGRELIGAVSARIDEMPEDDRPKLLVFGESLGSYGTESAFEDLEDLRARTDGAMLVGPTFTNPIHGDLTDGRDEGSPSWRPIIEDGQEVRFYVEPGDEQDPALTGGAEWEAPRVTYLQNSSDPITYFNPELLWKPPSWLDDPRGPDVSSDMVWVPVVTFWQVAADMAFSMGVPAGHGHRYGSNVVDGWVALATPEGWTADDTEALRQLTDQRADERDKRKEAAG